MGQSLVVMGLYTVLAIFCLMLFKPEPAFWELP
jgi:hypothetical protein